MPATRIPEATSEAIAAAVIVQAGNSPAMQAALDEIERQFGVSAEIKSFKDRCRRFIERGARHPAATARYGARARLMVGWNTADAAAWLACRYATEQRRWRAHDARLSLMVLRELRLIARFMRARRIALAPVIAELVGE
jgi:hypothetical protein